MTKAEKSILKKMILTNKDPLTQADVINGFARRDYIAIRNLIVKGYIQEVPRDMGKNGLDYEVVHFRVTEKGLWAFPFYKWLWFNFTEQTAVWMGIISILVSIGTLAYTSYVNRKTQYFTAYTLPSIEKQQKQQDEIQSLYQNIIINESILISNWHRRDNWPVVSNEADRLPEPFIEISIDDSIKSKLKNEFGLFIFRFLEYYSAQTSLTNKIIESLRNEYAVNGPNSKHYLAVKDVYIKSLNNFTQGSGVENFNYYANTKCLEKIFQKGYNFLTLEKDADCNSKTFDWINSYVGGDPQGTPSWFWDQLKASASR